MNLFNLNGEVAFVTGAGSGIGQAIAVGLAEAGAHVACFGHNSKGGLDTTAEKIEKLGKKALILEGEADSEQSISEAISITEKELGPLSIGVNNAAIAGKCHAEDMDLDTWKKVYRVNVEGVFLCCKLQAERMLKRGKGSIINIASISGIISNKGLYHSHYNSSKAAVIHMSKSFAVEWATLGVRVNVISPGYTLTPMNKRPEITEQLKIFCDDTPMNRMAEVDEMVGPAVFLASKASSFVTGHNLVVDGGFVCW